MKLICALSLAQNIKAQGKDGKKIVATTGGYGIA